MKFFAQSDKGQERKVNQDSYGYYLAESGMGFFIVADGMGGYNAGEVASANAVDSFINKAKGNPIVEDAEQKAEFLKKMFRRANDIILFKAAADPAKAGMGTTAVAAIVKDEEVIIGNLGDSRAYIISEGKMTQITEDHSFVEELLKAGKIDKEEAKTHPRRNEITKAIGVESYVEPDIFKPDIKKGDILLLCTDGLDKMVEDSVILDIVSSNAELSEICQKLIDEANAAGGLDNITVLAVEI